MTKMQYHPVHERRFNSRMIRERDKYTCQKCGRTTEQIDMEVHHIKPLCFGGDNESENLTLLCLRCHKFAPNDHNKFPTFIKSGLPISLDSARRHTFQILYLLKYHPEFKKLVMADDEASFRLLKFKTLNYFQDLWNVVGTSKMSFWDFEGKYIFCSTDRRVVKPLLSVFRSYNRFLGILLHHYRNDSKKL